MAQADHRDAFARCFTDCWPRVCRYLRSRGGGADTQDLASEVFSLAWQKWRIVPDDPLPWLLKSARFTLANHHRRQRTRGGHAGDALLSLAQPDTTEDLIAGRQQARRTLAALGALPASDREALLLVTWDELTPAQAGRAAGCSAATFRMRLHRARRRLRQSLADPTPTDLSLDPACTSD